MVEEQMWDLNGKNGGWFSHGQFSLKTNMMMMMGISTSTWTHITHITTKVTAGQGLMANHTCPGFVGQFKAKLQSLYIRQQRSLQTAWPRFSIIVSFHSTFLSLFAIPPTGQSQGLDDKKPSLILRNCHNVPDSLI